VPMKSHITELKAEIIDKNSELKSQISEMQVKLNSFKKSVQ